MPKPFQCPMDTQLNPCECALRYAEELAQEREAPLKERIAELEVKLQKWMGNASMAGCELLRQTWSIRETGIGSTAKEDSHG